MGPTGQTSVVKVHKIQFRLHHLDRYHQGYQDSYVERPNQSLDEGDMT
jgi:hypothetical protein